MKRLIATLASLVALLLASACDRDGRPVQELGLEKLTKGVSTEAEVKQAMGPPGMVFEEEDGIRILEYAKGPEGARTWMFRIGTDGKLQDYHQVLTEENFAKIQAGMTKGEVRWLLGTPRKIVPYKLSGEEVWDWRYFSINPAVRLFNVHFDAASGKVKRTSSTDDLERQGG